MSLCFESQSEQLVENPTGSDLDLLLGRLDGASNSYASLIAPSGSYVQVGGGPEEFTVEIREQRQDGSIRHLKAGLKDGPSDERTLLIGGAAVTVRENQVLDIATVRQLFRFFAREQAPDPSVVWLDMTSMFA